MHVDLSLSDPTLNPRDHFPQNDHKEHSGQNVIVGRGMHYKSRERGKEQKRAQQPHQTIQENVNRSSRE